MVNRRLTLMPSASVISRFEAPARTHMPTRVIVTATYSASATSTPTTMISRRKGDN